MRGTSRAISRGMFSAMRPSSDRRRARAQRGESSFAGTRDRDELPTMRGAAASFAGAGAGAGAASVMRGAASAAAASMRAQTSRRTSGGSPFCAAHRRAHFFLQRFLRRKAADVTHLAGNSSRSARHSVAALMRTRCSKTRTSNTVNLSCSRSHLSRFWPDHLCVALARLVRCVRSLLCAYRSKQTLTAIAATQIARTIAKTTGKILINHLWPEKPVRFFVLRKSNL